MTDDSLSTVGAPRRPQRIVTMLVDPEPTTLVALTNSADPTMMISGKINEGLLTYDFDLTPRPQLAVEWAADPGNLALHFRLRPNVYWHDGRPFRSADVAASIMLLKQLHPRGRSTFANVIEVQTPDPLTAVIRLARPAPALIYALAGAESPMLPAHRYEGVPPAESPNENTPIGTGPYVFREWVRGSHIALARNPSYWDSPRPQIDELSLRFIRDPVARVHAIETGAIDIAPQTPVPVVELNRLSQLPQLSFETRGYEYTNQIVRLEFNLDHPIFGRYEVRRAIAHTIDRYDLVARAWDGYAKIALGPISPDLKPYGSEQPAVPVLDHGEAERWLDAAGWPRGAHGKRFSILLDFVPAGDGYQRTAERIAEALAEIGIGATIRMQDFPSYVRRLYTDRDFGLAIVRSNNMFDPSVGVQRIYWSRNFRKGVPFSNGSHYASPIADNLLEQAAVEVDPVKRKDLYVALQKRIVADLPDIGLVAPAQITIASRRVKDHTNSAEGPNANFAELKISS
jgi:peptide/nickel transport system substrate-binding protein